MHFDPGGAPIKLFGYIHVGYNWTHVTVTALTAICMYSRVLNVHWSARHLENKRKIEIHFSLHGQDVCFVVLT
jgi:hypothetical protein